MKNILFLFAILALLNSCIKNNPDPSWITIDNWQLNENPNNIIDNSGLLTHNLSEAWVYVDNDLMGVFELPITIPVLKEGLKEIKIFPAIKNNGISATKKIYPFMEPMTVSLNLVQNEVQVVNPVTQYYTSTKFNIEDFENGGPSLLVEGSTSSTSMIYASNPLVLDSDINGTKYAQINLNEINSQWIASTIFNDGGSALNMALPIGVEVYLEIDYHSTNEFTTGLLGIGSNGLTDNPNVQVAASEPENVVWKKIYIDLREVVSGMQNKDYYEFSFQAKLDEGATTGQINIDNLKAVYF